MATDLFATQSKSTIGPIDNFVTPTLDADLATYGRALWVGVSGDVAILTPGGTNSILPAVAAGMWHPQLVRKVITTGTTATGIRVGID